jgi:hypothetical protein
VPRLGAAQAEENILLAKKAAARALEIDRELAEAHGGPHIWQRDTRFKNAKALRRNSSLFIQRVSNSRLDNAPTSRRIIPRFSYAVSASWPLAAYRSFRESVDWRRRNQHR